MDQFMNYNLIDTRAYDRDLYLEIFETLHNVDDIPPYPAWPQDNQYYNSHMDTFMNDMQLLLINDRALFDQILVRIQNRRRGQSVLRDRMRALIGLQNPPQNIRAVGGRRRSRKSQRRSHRKSRNNRTL
jgi:hypothetical protein